VRSVGLKTLKNKLSEYVRLAAEGETVLITDRERVVAELTPPSPSRAVAVTDAQLADLVRTGVLTPPFRRGAPPPTTPVASLDELKAELAADREDR
jgi:prevent-host-death family protein